MHTTATKAIAQWSSLSTGFFILLFGVTLFTEKLTMYAYASSMGIALSFLIMTIAHDYFTDSKTKGTVALLPFQALNEVRCVKLMQGSPAKNGFTKTSTQTVHLPQPAGLIQFWLPATKRVKNLATPCLLVPYHGCSFGSLA
jgi:hypothetical protein